MEDEPMAIDGGLSRRKFLAAATGSVAGLAGVPAVDARIHGRMDQNREVFSGISTSRIIPGQPYDLAGNRIVFTNWYYVHPGDLDWINARGESVYVKGSEGLFGAT